MLTLRKSKITILGKICSARSLNPLLKSLSSVGSVFGSVRVHSCLSVNTTAHFQVLT